MSSPRLIVYPLTLFLFVVAFSRESRAERASEAEASDRRVEVLFLGSKNRSNHDPPTRFRVLREALGPKAVNITYAHTLDALTPENLAKYDVLLIFANHYTIDKETQGKALLDFARGGGGCVLLHCAAGCFRDSQFDEYVDLLGAQFKSHGKGVFRAKIVNTEHPVMKGWDSFECWDETYEHKRQGKDRVILQMRDEEPWTWVKTYGKGRVFYTASGHDHRCWDLPAFHDLVHRAIRWTANDEGVNWLSPEELPELDYRPAAAPKDPDDPVGPLNEIQKPLPPEDSLKLAQLPPGFEIELFASEPMVMNPIAINWDSHGRLWVVEAFDYPHKIGTEEPRDRIKIIEDTDGDGRGDKVTVFAEGLNICTSILPVKGGAITTDGPNMVMLRDTDGTGKADRKEVIWSGIGLRDTHACVSNLRHGFDGWVYASVGYSGLDVTLNNVRHKSSQGVFRFLPDGTGFEVLQNTSNNTWGLSFTEEGDLVGSTANGNPSWFLSVPNRYFKMVGRDPQQVSKADRGEKLAPITWDYFQNNPKELHSSAAGHAVYTSNRFPEEWQNNRVFICEPPMHLITAPSMKRRGDRFETSGFEHNLYASADAWSAPVAAEVGPDGAVWIADWYNPICNHNPYRKHLELGTGNAFRSNDRDRSHGRIYRVFPAGTKDDPLPNLESEADALQALDHPNLFWRLAAQRVLTEALNPERLAALTKAEKDPRVRFHLLLAASNQQLDPVQIAGLARSSSDSLPTNSLNAHLECLNDLSRDPLIRKAAALRLVESTPDAIIGTELAKLVLSDKGLQENHHLGDAVRLAIIRHPEGFFRFLLETKQEVKERYTGRIVKDSLTRFRASPDVLSDGLVALARLSNGAIAKALVKAAKKPAPLVQTTRQSPSAARGEKAYLACVACHQPNGKGLLDTFPPLAGSKRLLGDPELPIKIILKGLQGELEAGGEKFNGVMPGHELLLKDKEIADVLNYVRSAWGNQAPEITAAKVKEVRAETADRKIPWTIDALKTKH